MELLIKGIYFHSYLIGMQDIAFHSASSCHHSTFSYVLAFQFPHLMPSHLVCLVAS